jgi:hypothetical protein
MLTICRRSMAVLALSSMPALVLAQEAPVAEAFRNKAKQVGKNLMAAADVMPADKYGYKPTPDQLSFGDIVVLVAGANDFLCAGIGGVKAPSRSEIAPTDPKDALVARLRETFQFCDQALEKLDDSKLTEQLPMTAWTMARTMSGGTTMPRIAVEFKTVGDWVGHLARMAQYLRANDIPLPAARK